MLTINLDKEDTNLLRRYLYDINRSKAVLNEYDNKLIELDEDLIKYYVIKTLISTEFFNQAWNLIKYKYNLMPCLDYSRVILYPEDNKLLIREVMGSVDN